MTISRKLYASFAAALVFTSILGITSWVALTHIGEQIRISSLSTHNLQLAGKVGTLTSDMLSLERGMVIRTLLKNPDVIEKYNTKFLKDAATRQDVLKEYVTSPAISEKARKLIQGMLDTYPEMLEGQGQLYKLSMAGDGVGAAALQKNTLMTITDAAEADAQSLDQIAAAQVAEIATSNQSTVTSSIWLTGIMVLLSFGIGAAVIYIVRGINGALSRSVVELSEGAQQIASASAQVSSSSQSLAMGASQQAAALEETSASSEEINSMAHKNRENAAAMATLVSDSKSKFVDTNRLLGDMMTAMDDINESSGRIAKIIKIIDEIAFQTNILALNAAVEAARAGESGMGFAVVADEVRSLAQRSAQAAKDTERLIEDSVIKSEAGKLKVRSVVDSIQQISDEFTGLNILVDEVSHGSTEQSAGISLIGKALSQMEQVTQTTVATAEESAAAAQQLNAQSESMKDLTARLNNMVGAQLEAGFSINRRKPLHSDSPTSVAPATFTRSLAPRSKAAALAAETFPLEDSFSSF